MGKNLSLRTRRMLARGINPYRNGRKWAGAPWLSINTGNRARISTTLAAATLTTAMTGANNDIKLTATTLGAAGGEVFFQIVVAGNNTALTVAVSGNTITVNSATGAGGAATSTAAQVISAINGSGPAAALATAANAAGNDGTGVVTAYGLTALTRVNNDIVVFSKTPGTGGNSTTFRVVVSGNNTPLSVSVAGSAITVNAATNGSAASISTANEIVNAVNQSPTAGPLVWARLAPGNDGTGVVTAFGPTSLAGAV